MWISWEGTRTLERISWTFGDPERLGEIHGAALVTRGGTRLKGPTLPKEERHLGING